MSPRLSLSLLFLLSLPAVLRGEEPNAKAARLLEPLAKRPGAAALFERFVNAWLDTGTLESLGEYLTKRAVADGSPANRLLLAQFHTRQGEPVKALEQFRAALATDAGNAETWMLKGQTEARMLDFTAAMESLKKCLAAGPAEELSARAAQLLGRVQARAGQTEAALATWGALMQSRPADEELREDVLEIQIAESLWPAALENAALLAERTADPYKRVLRRMRLGDVQDRSGQRDKALAMFAACLEDAGAGSWLEKEILAQIDKLFRREDDLSGLRAFLEKHAQASPQRAGVQRMLAKLLMETGETDAALEVSRKLMALMPGERTVREEFIAMLTGAGRAAEAIPQVQQMIAAAPADAELHLILAGLYHETKDEEGVLKAVEQFQQLAAADPGTPVRAAAVLDQYGMAAAAVKSLRAALERDKLRTDLRQMLASLLHKSGEKPAAMEEWRALAASGDLPAALQAARAMLAAGEPDAAWALLLQQVPRGGGDVMFLNQLATLADTEARAVEALPHVRGLVGLAKSAPDLDAALDEVLRVARKANAVESLTAELSHSAKTAAELSLLAMLRESGRDTAGAAEALEKAKSLDAAVALSQMVRLKTLRGDFAGAAQAAESQFESARTVAVAEMLTSLHRRAGNPQGAMKWVQEWKKLAPGSASPVLEEASLLQAEGRDMEAIAALRSAAGRMEQNTEIRARLASACAAAGQSAEAQRLYAALFEEANDLAGRMRWLQPWAETARAAGKLDELIAQFDERRRENRTSTAPLMALAELHRMADNYPERRKALSEALRLKPDDAEILIELSRLEEREGRREDAIATLRAALPGDKTGRIAQRLSEMLIASGAQEEGLALIKSGKSTQAQVLQLAFALQSSGNGKAALTLVKESLSAWPGDWELDCMAAALEAGNQQRREAVQRCLRLLDFQPRNTAPQVQTKAWRFPDYLIAALPAHATTMLRLLAWREMRSGAGVFRRRVAGRSIMPLNAEEVPYFAAGVLAGLLHELPKDERMEALEELSARGFGCAELLPMVQRTRDLLPSEYPVDGGFLRKKRPDDAAVLVYAALLAAYSSWASAPDEAVARAAWEAFQKDAPEAALFLALPAAAMAKPEEPWAQQVLAAMEARAASTPLLNMALVRALTPDRDRGQQEPPAHARLLMQLYRWSLAETAGRQGYAGEVRQSAFTALGREFLRRKNLSALREVLEGEWQKGGDPVLVIGAMSGSVAQPLGFPPRGMAGVPEQVTDFLAEDGLPAVAADLAGLVQEPVLKLLLMGRSPAGAAAADVEALIASRPGEAVPLILAASLAEKRGDFQQAGVYAVKAQFLPVHPVMRRQLDSALAWWAQRAGVAGDALYSAGREAALRLRRDALSPDDRTELASLMDVLGLTEEADRLMRQSTAQSTGASPLERAEKLVRAGRGSEALPILLQDMRSRAQLWMTTVSDLFGDQELEHWRSLVYAGGLMPAVQKAMLPLNATPRQLAEYAALCDLAMIRPEALPAAGRAAAAAPAGNWHLRWRQLRLQLRAEPAKAAEHLLASGLEWNKEVIDLCRDTLMENTTLESSLHFARMIEGILKVSPEKAGPGFPAGEVLSAMQVSAACGRYFAVGDAPEPEQVRMLPVDLPAGERERVVRLKRERDEMTLRVGAVLATRPGCALEVWEHFHGKTAPDGVLDAAIAAAAELVAKKNLEELAAESTAEKLSSLAMDAVQAGKPAEFEKKVLQPWISGNGALQEHAEPLQRKWPMLSCPAAEFEAVAVKYLAHESEEDSGNWSAVAEIARLRELGDGLTPVMLAEFQPQHPRAEEARAAVPEWGQMVLKRQGEKAAADFIKAAIKAAGEQSRKPGEEGPDARMNLIRSLSWSEELLPLLMEIMIAEKIPLDALDDDCLASAVTALRNGGEVESLRRIMDLTGAGGQPADLKLPVDTLMKAWSVMNLPEKALEAMGAAGPVDKLGFGWQLLYLASKEKADWWTLLARWQPQLAALPEEPRERILRSLMNFGDERPLRTPEGMQFRQWAGQFIANDEKQEISVSAANFLRNADAGEIDDADTLQQQVSGMVSDILFTTPPEMQAVVDKAVVIARKLGSEDAYAAVAGGLVDDIGNHRVDPVQAAWRVSLASRAAQQGVHGRYFFGYRMSEASYHILRNSEDSVDGRLADFVKLTAPGLTQPVRLWMLCWLLDGLSGDTGLTQNEAMDRALRWLNQHRTEHPELAGDMESAILIRRAVSDWNGRPDLSEAEWPEGLRRLLTALRSEATPAGVRLEAMEELLDDFSSAAPRVLVEECSRLLIRTLKERQPVHRDVESTICAALAMLPDALRDNALVKELTPLLQIARPRGEITDYQTTAGMNALMDIALCAGEGAVVDRLLEAEGLFPNAVSLGVLARRGDTTRLAAITRSKPQTVRNDSGWGMQYDALLHSRLPAVLESVASVDDRLLLQVKLAVLRDPENVSGFPPRRQRIADAAAVVAAHEWSNPLARDRALAELVRDPAVPGVLLPLLEEVAARVPLYVVWSLNDDSPHSELSDMDTCLLLHEARLDGPLRRGDMAPLLEIMRGIHALPAAHRGKRLTESLMQSAGVRILAGWEGLSPEQQVQVCSGWRSCLELSGPDTVPLVDILRGLLLHLLAGQQAEWDAWAALLDVTFRAVLLDAEVELKGSLRDLIPEGAGKLPGPPERRMAAAAALFSRASKYTLWHDEGMPDPFLVVQKREEFLQLEPGVMAAGGDAWTESAFARNLVVLERWPEVLTRTEKALAGMAPSGTTAWLPLVELQVQALEKTGRAAEAAAWKEKARKVEIPFEAKLAGVIRGASRRLAR